VQDRRLDQPDVEEARSDGITVVLPTWNRPQGLRRALLALAEQAPPAVPWDVVVVASARDPAAHQAVAGLPYPSAVDLRVVDEAAPGASNARNRGLAEARRVVAFLDDDCVPEPGWLAAVTEPVLSGRWQGCGGRVRVDPNVRPPRWLGDALLAYLADYDRGGEEAVLGPEDFLLTANAAFDAELLARAGGFDPLLGPRAGAPMVDDDVDICRKVRRLGGTIGYRPSAVVVHDLPAARLRPGYLLRRMYAQGRSDWLLDRSALARRRDRGVASAGARLAEEQRSILGQGPWHPAVAFHALGSLARAAGFVVQALSISPPGGGLRSRRRRAVGARPAGRG
jgi:GT2 family glycosyltransferase